MAEFVEALRLDQLPVGRGQIACEPSAIVA